MGLSQLLIIAISVVTTGIAVLVAIGIFRAGDV